MTKPSHSIQTRLPKKCALVAAQLRRALSMAGKK